MSIEVECLSNKATEAEIAEHLSRCDANFIPPLSSRIKIGDYAKKIVCTAVRIEAWSSSTLVGLVATYCNDQVNGVAYVTSVSVLREWKGKGIATRLIKQCIENAKASGMRQISLEVASDNRLAIRLYEKNGFVAGRVSAPFVCMDLNLMSGK